MVPFLTDLSLGHVQTTTKEMTKNCMTMMVGHVTACIGLKILTLCNKYPEFSICRPINNKATIKLCFPHQPA